MAAETRKAEAPKMGLWLEVDLDSEPISGSIHEADDSPKLFVGWLGFTALLEALRTGRVITTTEHAAKDVPTQEVH